MELLKNIKSAVNFEDRYSDMEGSEGGYSRKERKALDRAKKSGASLRGYQEDRSEYLDTVSNERKRFAGNVASTAVGVGLGLMTGNPNLVTSSLGSGMNYLGGEMAENAAGNDGLNQQLGVQDFANMASPFLSAIGHQQAKDGRTLEYKAGGSLRYNPRKYDYIKGNTFGF